MTARAWRVFVLRSLCELRHSVPLAMAQGPQSENREGPRPPPGAPASGATPRNFTLKFLDTLHIFPQYST